jgi:hypothetical protein
VRVVKQEHHSHAAIRLAPQPDANASEQQGGRREASRDFPSRLRALLHLKAIGWRYSGQRAELANTFEKRSSRGLKVEAREKGGGALSQLRRRLPDAWYSQLPKLIHILYTRRRSGGRGPKGLRRRPRVKRAFAPFSLLNRTAAQSPLRERHLHANPLRVIGPFTRDRTGDRSGRRRTPCATNAV